MPTSCTNLSFHMTVTMIYYIRHQKICKSFTSLLNALETVNQAEINKSSKMGDSLFKLGRYNRVFLEIWAQIPMRPCVETVSCGDFFLVKILQKGLHGNTKINFFYKNKERGKKGVMMTLNEPCFSIM